MRYVGVERRMHIPGVQFFVVRFEQDVGKWELPLRRKCKSEETLLLSRDATNGCKCEQVLKNPKSSTRAGFNRLNL
jgi:hypothetical protein